MAKRDQLPFQGTRVHAERRLFEEVIVFVHHYGGHKGSVKRHQDFVASLGYDSIAFNLSFNSPKTWRKPLITRELKIGMRHVWAKEIETILNLVAERKIIYSFSSPSAAALEAMARRETKDISGWVCDGGPFLKLISCFWNYFTYQKPIRNPLLKTSLVMSSYHLIGGLRYGSDMKSYLDALPSRFPVLSIRSWQDRLVPVSAIDEIFKNGQDLDLQILGLPEADHLQGFFKFPDEYKPRVERFLKSLSHPISRPT